MSSISFGFVGFIRGVGGFIWVPPGDRRVCFVGFIRAGHSGRALGVAGLIFARTGSR